MVSDALSGVEDLSVHGTGLIINIFQQVPSVALPVLFKVKRFFTTFQFMKTVFIGWVSFLLVGRLTSVAKKCYTCSCVVAPRWGTMNAEMKDPPGWSPGLSKVPSF